MKKKLLLSGNEEVFNFERVANTSVQVSFEDSTVEGTLVSSGSSDQFDVIRLNGRNQRVKRVGDYISIDGKNYKVESATAALAKKSGGEGNMASPMPGKILKVMVEVGAEVAEGEGLLVMEAMKMEHTIKAAHAGTVAAIHYKEGDLVDGGVDLLELVQSENE